jgi:hypothetical protein
MSLFNEKLLREIIAEEVRPVLREEWASVITQNRPYKITSKPAI